MISKRGFTLVELVAVLFILSLLTFMAVQSVDQVKDQARYEATQRQLTDISEAIGAEATQSSALPRPVSFITDLGRLPKQRTGGADICLRELWLQQSGAEYSLPAFSLLQGPNDGTANDSDVKIGAGWRGPYLRMPAGQSALRDGWANPYEISFLNGGQQIGLRSLGSNNLPEPAAGDEYRADLPEAAQIFESTAKVSGFVFERQSSGAPVALAGAVVYVLYPKLDATDANIAIERIPATPVTTGPNGEFEIDNVPLGRRVIRAWYSAPLPGPLPAGHSQPATLTIDVPKGGRSNIELVIR
ncbi:MAG TPA: prepilin-type N-terminal cleavage/methylation domain-containing protein [Planctomycetota bacterium]|nr:prepilin-type N-terminal cleavage/methylation domain-containing protein [Planctomycetota bacterium]